MKKFTASSYRRSLPMVAMLAAGALLGGCARSPSAGVTIDTANTTALRPLTTSEAFADYDALVDSIRSLYGPLEYKEKRFGFSFAREAARIRAELIGAKTDGDKMAKSLELLRLLQDGHVSLTQPIRERFEIPLVAMPVEGKTLVAKIHSSLAPYGIEVGDEILSVDGVTPDEVLKTALKYTWFGNAESDKHMVYYMFRRPSFIPELAPKGPFALIEFAKASGEKKSVRIAWTKTSPQIRNDLAPKTSSPESARGPARLLAKEALTSKAVAERVELETSLADFGATKPWYWNEKLKRTYGVTLVTPERERVATFYPQWLRALNPAGLPGKRPDLPDPLPEVFAALYRHQGKTILLVRQPSYVADSYPVNLAIYSALFDQYQGIADVLVIDQTHNPGGYVTYTEGMARLIAPKGTNGFVQFMNTDRRWYNEFTEYWTSLPPAVAGSPIGSAVLEYARAIERDGEAGLRLTREPFSFSLFETLPAGPGAWNKPVLVVIDELCASGGDAFPMLVKANGLGTLFGTRTAGMGGSVESALELPFSRAELMVTRGLFTAFRPDGKYNPAEFVENNGVTPDLPYSHSVKDFRDGFVGYFKALSEAAIGKIPEVHQPAKAAAPVPQPATPAAAPTTVTAY